MRLATELVTILQDHCGERGDNEGAADTLRRIIRERNEAQCPDPLGWKELCECAVRNGGDWKRRCRTLETEAEGLRNERDEAMQMLEIAAPFAAKALRLKFEALPLLGENSS